MVAHAFCSPTSLVFKTRAMQLEKEKMMEYTTRSSIQMAKTGGGDDGTNMDIFSKLSEKKGKILILGGSGFLGTAVANRAILEGYLVTSLSRRGKPPKVSSGSSINIDYRQGDARDLKTIRSILEEDDYTAIIHCIGILFDDGSGLRSMNRFVSGSGSISDKSSSYDDVTRKTAFNAIEAAEEYGRLRFEKNKGNNPKPLPFIFTSAAEAGWTSVRGGNFVESRLTPKWLKRYIDAKRQVERRLVDHTSPEYMRPVIFRPSLIYSLERIPSLPAVGALFAGNLVGLPFVDRPMSVQALSLAMIRSVKKEDVRGVLRYQQVNELIR
uniref:NAD-dependent epimerase/dehydratase domain-containing protein n=3 Tax=Ditylum brightwellii TaxID=49249 RepID=A0A7S4RIY3_9STRA